MQVGSVSEPSVEGAPFRSAAELKLQELAAKRAELTAPAYSRASLIMGCGVHVRGEGCYIEDHSGRRFLDFFDAYGNQAFGYGHPRLLAALRRQLDSGHTNTGKIFFDELPIRLAEALAASTNGALPCSFLTNGGAEAIEHALKLARASTRRPKFVTAVNAYHGKTFGAISAAARPEYEAMFSPLLQHFEAVPFGDVEALERAIDENTAGVLLESVQAEGGIVVPPAGYLRRARELCDARGALLILDEIQAGFGRTGRFFAFEHAGVLPDIVCIGKSFGGGMLAAAAMLAKQEVWTPFRVEPLAFGSSLGGSPLASAVALEALAMGQDPELLQKVRAQGEVVGRRLAELARSHPDVIESSRGVGLLHGLVVRDPAVVGLLLRLLYERGVVTTFCLFDQRVVRVEPPLIITDEQLDYGLSALEAAVAEAARYARQLPAAAIGVSAFELELQVPLDTEAAFRTLRDESYRHSPAVEASQRLASGSVTCQGRLGEIALDWQDELIVNEAEHHVEQRAVAGFWPSFVRSFRVRPGDRRDTSVVSLRVSWDVGTGGFERVLGLRLRYALEKAAQQSLAALFPVESRHGSLD